jgi:hypothetical protein
MVNNYHLANAINTASPPLSWQSQLLLELGLVKYHVANAINISLPVSTLGICRVQELGSVTRDIKPVPILSITGRNRS